MYKSAKERTKKTPKRRKRLGKVADFFRDVFMVRHLANTWKDVLPWVFVFVAVVLLSVFNEHKIEQKEREVRKLQKEKEQVMQELKKTNEVLYSEEEDALRQMAAERGYVAASPKDLFKVEKEEITEEEE